MFDGSGWTAHPFVCHQEYNQCTYTEDGFHDALYRLIVIHAFITDADRMAVVIEAMHTYFFQRAAAVYFAVAGQIEMIADVAEAAVVDVVCLLYTSVMKLWCSTIISSLPITSVPSSKKRSIDVRFLNVNI